MGIPIDRSTGNPVGSVPEVLQFSNSEIPAQATTNIQYQANLPTLPQTASANSAIPGSELIKAADFTANPLLLPATITGTGATLLADAAAVETGTADVSGLPTGGNNGTLNINSTPVTINATDSAATIVQAINAQKTTTGVSASLDPSHHIVLTSKDATTAIDLTGSTAAVLNELGLVAGPTNPTNLLSQGAVTSGQTLVITVGANPALTITFGTLAGQVQTLAQLQTKLAGLSGGNATVDLTNGNVTIKADNLTDQITVSGTAN